MYIIKGLLLGLVTFDNVKYVNIVLFLATFYNQPAVSDFIIDILVGSPQAEIRDTALDQFYILSQTEVTPSENTGHQQTPHAFMLTTLLKARLPFWVTASSTRGASFRWVVLQRTTLSKRPDV